MPKFTYYRKFGVFGTLTSAAKGIQKISNFFEPSFTLPIHSALWSACSDNGESDNNREEASYELGDVIAQLQEDLIKNEKTLNAFEYNERRAVYTYFTRLYDGHGKLKASENAARIVYINPNPYKYKRIRFLGNFYLRHESFLFSYHGRHQKCKRLVDDEDVALKCRQWIREESGVNGVSLSKFKQYVDSLILPEYTGGTRKEISPRTARRWLIVLGCQFKRYHKGMYFDEHERKNVVDYRNRFLEKMKILERRIATYEGEKMEPISPVLGIGERELIFVTHDECIFYANDRKRGIWVCNGMMPLCKKGNGKSIMVSKFVLEACRRLRLNEKEKQSHPNIPAEARYYLKPGKNKESYWTVEHLLKQIKENAITIFEAKFPGATAVFAFDNSMNHAAFANDALMAQRMNKGPRGKQSIMRPATFIDINGQVKAQEMVFEQDYPDPDMRRKPKGIKRVLEERGLFKDALNLDCLMCKQKMDSGQVDCCLRKIMASQLDFVAQKSAIVELIEDHCDYTWTGLQEMVPKALDSVDVVMFRKFTRKSWRYMELYRGGLIGKLAENACKKFKSHRRVPENELALFVQENKEISVLTSYEWCQGGGCDEFKRSEVRVEELERQEIRCAIVSGVERHRGHLKS
ncbi:hypothetical protein C2G38_2219929 [Gigaspora rosea]|uniref:Uncharacterized protein n=1 Tax=Gigaspora rosea TaxID=44941 RepID=A0A397U8B2_9GLOM|nr:hypothetical protein C2G38_2219929 [Gigaspora rosea]